MQKKFTLCLLFTSILFLSGCISKNQADTSQENTIPEDAQAILEESLIKALDFELDEETLKSIENLNLDLSTPEKSLEVYLQALNERDKIKWLAVTDFHLKVIATQGSYYEDIISQLDADDIEKTDCEITQLEEIGPITARIFCHPVKHFKDGTVDESAGDDSYFLKKNGENWQLVWILFNQQ